jgi:deoxyribodipyrimidine photo-lyase
MAKVPSIRLQQVNDCPVNPKGKFVLYWMMANRRTGFNFSLDRAIDWARELGKPLLIVEPLRCGYRWASDRIHRFVINGMADNAKSLETSPIGYYSYVEPKPGAGKGLIRALGQMAAVVVTDDYPCFFLPQAVAAAAGQLDVRLETVDSNGLLPLRAAERVYPTAYAFRRFLQKTLPSYLAEMPRQKPLAGLDLPPLKRLPKILKEKWPSAGSLETIPIDHTVAPGPIRGGPRAARAKLRRFLDRLQSYGDERNHPDERATSGLSPYLHFGHISSHEIFSAVTRREQWSSRRLRRPATGSRTGWWGLGASAEFFLDELITWREVGFNMAWQRPDSDEYESLPDWAQETLAEHENDPRSYVYSLDDFERARTHDELWNAAQTELTREGRIHNYLRMVWGKKILEWSPSPREALAVMTELNNKYALDGRDPNSSSGIFWVLGRYDRAWGPERPIFGKVRYMSSANTARKVRLKKYLEQFAPDRLDF